jgi:hypothetical protein
MTMPLAAFLGSVFGRPGIVLHGETAVKRRQALVQRFQEDERVPFFVLSLKAGGAGLNLTAASHVIHFDRWWNPAVENTCPSPPVALWRRARRRSSRRKGSGRRRWSSTVARSPR